MDFDAEDFVDRLLSDEAHQTPSDSVKVEDLEMQLPKWFDEQKYNQGRRFHWDFTFTLAGSMLMGLVAVLSVPSILNVLIGTKRSNSVYTAFKRYASTYFHKDIWFKNELKPGSPSWRSLYLVRSRHIQAGRSARLKGTGIVSQRDLALTLFGFIGFSFLKPDKFSITQLEEGDFDAYNHTWRVIGHMIGLEDRYNICRETYEETRQICQIILNRVYTPCLENVPEYFEHMTQVMLQGLGTIITIIEATSMIYATKNLAEVPGYIVTEEDRRNLQIKIKNHLKGKDTNTGVDSSELIQKCAIDGLPKRQPNLLYLRDFETIENSPAYRKLSFLAKYKLAFNRIFVIIYSTYYGRMISNLYLKVFLFLGIYFPYIAIWRYGWKNAFINIFKEDPMDNTLPKPNSEYNKPQPDEF